MTGGQLDLFAADDGRSDVHSDCGRCKKPAAQQQVHHDHTRTRDHAIVIVHCACGHWWQESQRLGRNDRWIR